MAWHDEGITLKTRLPKSLPRHHEDQNIEALLAVLNTKQSHKLMIPRAMLLVKLGWRTGLRRKELSNLETRDIHAGFLSVENGKGGGKDRIIPLAPTIAKELDNFIRVMKPNEKIHKTKTNLRPPQVSAAAIIPPEITTNS